jgi:hypothetical protein
MRRRKTELNAADEQHFSSRSILGMLKVISKLPAIPSRRRIGIEKIFKIPVLRLVFI